MSLVTPSTPPQAGRALPGRLPAPAENPNTITISQLSSLSFWTNKPTDGTNPDWTLYIYTAKEGAGDSGSFYRSRLNSEPYLSGNIVAPNTWFQWTSDGSNGNALRWYDSNRNGGTFGTFTDPTLATIQSGPINWPSASTWDYRNETILFFSLQTGSAWANGFTGLVDGLQINLTNGDVGNVNLEAVPEPATCAMFGLALAAIALRRIRR